MLTQYPRLEASRSQRILWLLEVLKAPYKIDIFHRDPKTKLAPPELKKIHSLGKSPVISIQPEGFAEPIVIAESGLITEYLCEHYGKGSSLVPQHWQAGKEHQIGGETAEWMRFKYYMHYGESSLMGFLMMALVAGRIKASPVPFFIKPITNRISAEISNGFISPNLKTHFQFLEDQLKTAPGGGKYLCGPKITAADILTSFPLIAARARSPQLTQESFPMLWEYIINLENNEDYLRACKKIEELDGKFEVLL